MSFFGDGRLPTHADTTRGPCALHAGAMAAQRAYITRWPIGPILGFWGGNVPQNGGFSAKDADDPPCKIRRR